MTHTFFKFSYSHIQIQTELWLHCRLQAATEVSRRLMKLQQHVQTTVARATLQCHSNAVWDRWHHRPQRLDHQHCEHFKGVFKDLHTQIHMLECVTVKAINVPVQCVYLAAPLQLCVPRGQKSVVELRELLLQRGV